MGWTTVEERIVNVLRETYNCIVDGRYGDIESPDINIEQLKKTTEFIVKGWGDQLTHAPNEAYEHGKNPEMVLLFNEDDENVEESHRLEGYMCPVEMHLWVDNDIVDTVLQCNVVFEGNKTYVTELRYDQD